MDHDLGSQMARIGSGDPEAFSAFYESWFDEAVRMTMGATKRDESFCLDVVQEVMMKVIRRTPRTESEGELRVWLHRAVLTTSYDIIKSEARRGRRESVAGHSAETIESPVRNDDRLDWLREEIAKLDPTAAFLLEARHRFGWTLARIGATLGMKTGAVDRKLRTLTGELRRRNEEALDE